MYSWRSRKQLNQDSFLVRKCIASHDSSKRKCNTEDIVQYLLAQFLTITLFLDGEDLRGMVIQLNLAWLDLHDCLPWKLLDIPNSILRCAGFIIKVIFIFHNLAHHVDSIHVQLYNVRITAISVLLTEPQLPVTTRPSIRACISPRWRGCDIA